jgi:TRAP-type mannitol/chloroaromatic compound transport system substrate-binding protein
MGHGNDWPRGLDTVFGGADVFAEAVSLMTGGKFTINPRRAGELVGAHGTRSFAVTSAGSSSLQHSSQCSCATKEGAVHFVGLEIVESHPAGIEDFVDRADSCIRSLETDTKIEVNMSRL